MTRASRLKRSRVSVSIVAPIYRSASGIVALAFTPTLPGAPRCGLVSLIL